MRERSDALDAAMRSLARRVEFPATPALAPTVAARLRADAVRAHRPPLPGLAVWPRRRVVVALALGLLLLAGTAVAARIAIGPVSVEIVPSLSPGAPPEAPAAFGPEVTLAKAAASTDIQPRWPPSLGRPDDVYVVDGAGPGAAVVLAWRGEEGARIAATPWTTVLFELRGAADMATKYVGAYEIHAARVHGERAFWISGAHDLLLRGGFEGNRVRVSGNVLIWEGASGVVYRLETTLDEKHAISLAETLA